MQLKNSIKNIGIQTALKPEDFFNLLNSGKVIEAIELNKKNERNKKYYHELKYNGTVFVTNTETELYEL